MGIFDIEKGKHLENSNTKFYNPPYIEFKVLIDFIALPYKS